MDVWNSNKWFLVCFVCSGTLDIVNIDLYVILLYFRAFWCYLMLFVGCLWHGYIYIYKHLSKLYFGVFLFLWSKMFKIYFKPWIKLNMGPVYSDTVLFQVCWETEFDNSLWHVCNMDICVYKHLSKYIYGCLKFKLMVVCVFFVLFWIKTASIGFIHGIIFIVVWCVPYFYRVTYLYFKLAWHSIYSATVSFSDLLIKKGFWAVSDMDMYIWLCLCKHLSVGYSWV